MYPEWVLLADGAQVHGGKLYLLGGCWNIIQHPGAFPFSKEVTIVTAMTIPWGETNQKHPWALTVVDEDGAQVCAASGVAEAGRPLNIPAGAEQRVLMTFSANITFTHPGTYAVNVAAEDAAPAQRMAFHVVAAEA